MKPVLVIGGGGHARVVIDSLRQSGAEIVGIIDADPAKIGQTVLGVPVVGGDEVIEASDPHGVHLALGIASVGAASLRARIAGQWLARGFVFPVIRHPSAIIAADCLVDAGAQIMAGAVVQPNTRLDTGALVNTGARVDHDCQLGPYAHVAPGAILCGFVSLGRCAFVGAGAVVTQSVRVADEQVLPAGSLTTAKGTSRPRLED